MPENSVSNIPETNPINIPEEVSESVTYNQCVAMINDLAAKISELKKMLTDENQEEIASLLNDLEAIQNVYETIITEALDTKVDQMSDEEVDEMYEEHGFESIPELKEAGEQEKEMQECQDNYYQELMAKHSAIFSSDQNQNKAMVQMFDDYATGKEFVSIANLLSDINYLRYMQETLKFYVNSSFSPEEQKMSKEISNSIIGQLIQLVNGQQMDASGILNYANAYINQYINMSAEKKKELNQFLGKLSLSKEQIGENIDAADMFRIIGSYREKNASRLQHSTTYFDGIERLNIVEKSYDGMSHNENGYMHRQLGAFEVALDKTGYAQSLPKENGFAVYASNVIETMATSRLEHYRQIAKYQQTINDLRNKAAAVITSTTTTEEKRAAIKASFTTVRTIDINNIPDAKSLENQLETTKDDQEVILFDQTALEQLGAIIANYAQNDLILAQRNKDIDSLASLTQYSDKYASSLKMSSELYQKNTAVSLEIYNIQQQLRTAIPEQKQQYESLLSSKVAEQAAIATKMTAINGPVSSITSQVTSLAKNIEQPTNETRRVPIGFDGYSNEERYAKLKGIMTADDKDKIIATTRQEVTQEHDQIKAQNNANFARIIDEEVKRVATKANISADELKQQLGVVDNPTIEQMQTIQRNMTQSTQIKTPSKKNATMVATVKEYLKPLEKSTKLQEIPKEAVDTAIENHGRSK